MEVRTLKRTGGLFALLPALTIACSSAIVIKARDATPSRPAPGALEISRDDQTGRRFDLRSTVAKKPTVVIFYRGHW